MNEAETRAELIDPALKEAGWGVVDGSRVRREVITLASGTGKTFIAFQLAWKCLNEHIIKNDT